MRSYEKYSGVEATNASISDDYIDEFVADLKNSVKYTLKNEGLSNEDILEGDIFDNCLMEFIDTRFIYYNDAFEYLESAGITDFSEAINDECRAETVDNIARYYLEEDIYIII